MGTASCQEPNTLFPPVRSLLTKWALSHSKEEGERGNTTALLLQGLPVVLGAEQLGLSLQSRYRRGFAQLEQRK